MSTKNIETLEHDQFSWADHERASSLRSVHDKITLKLDDCIAWYRQKRASKRLLAWCFRVGAIILGAATAAMPTVSEIASRGGQTVDWWFRPGTATIFGILAGVLIMMDKFIGASSAWVRFMLAETALRELRDELVIAFALETGEWAGEDDACVEQTKHGLTVLQTYLTRANQIVRDETNQWKAEFQSALAQSEEYAKVPPRKVEDAGLTIKLSNPERLAGPWAISLNGGTEIEVTGDSKSFRLAPGVITVRARATVKAGKDDQQTASFATEASEVLAAGTVKVITFALPPKQP